MEKQAAWHVGIKETYSDVYGSWIAFSSQLTKRYWFHDGLAVSRETQGGVVVSSLPVAWDWGSFNGVFHVKHGELLTGGDWSALFSFAGCCGGGDVSRETLTFLLTMRLIRRWEKLSISVGEESEKVCQLAWSSLLPEASHVWGC